MFVRFLFYSFFLALHWRHLQPSNQRKIVKIYCPIHQTSNFNSSIDCVVPTVYYIPLFVSKSLFLFMSLTYFQQWIIYCIISQTLLFIVNSSYIIFFIHECNICLFFLFSYCINIHVKPNVSLLLNHKAFYITGT